MNIRCERLRLALATCKTEELARLQLAFAECFEEGEETVFATWSEVIEAGYASRMPCNDTEFAMKRAPLNWGSAYHEQFGKSQIPGAIQFASHSSWKPPIPHELMEQINTIKALKGPVIVQYQKREWIISDIYNAACRETICEGMPGNVFVTTWEGQPDRELEIDLEIVPKELIALNL